jgi:hypothetical protein
MPEAVIESAREVASRYSWSGLRYALENVNDGPLSASRATVLAAHDREVAAHAWDEGERHESEYLATYGQFCPSKTCNPYRPGSEGKKHG